MTDADATTRHPALRMAILIAQLAFGLLAMTICLPSMQDWAATFGTTQAAVQLTFSGFVAAYGGMQLVYGPVSDRIGRKPVLMVGLGIALAGCVLAALAPNLAVLSLARVLQGAGVAAGMVTGRAMVQDLYQGAARTRAMALIGMSMGVCPPLATLVGGALHVRLGWQANFWVMAGMGVLLVAAAWWALPSLPPREPARAGAVRALVRSYATLVRERGFLLYVAVMSSTTATFYVFLGGTPLVLRNYGVRPDQLGWYIGAIPVAYIVGNFITVKLSHHKGDRFILGWGHALTLLGVALVITLGFAPLRTPLALALPLLLLGLGHGLIVPPTLAGTVGLVPLLAGAAAALGGVSQQLLGAFGGFLAGVVPHDTQVGLGALMLLFTGTGLVAQLALWRVLRTR